MTRGRRRLEGAGPDARRSPRLLLGALLAAAAWVFLVQAAVDFGRAAIEEHEVTRWVLTLVAGAGAALCLMLVFVLLARMRRTPAVRRPPGRRRR